MDYNLTEYHKELSRLTPSQQKNFINSYYPIVGNSEFIPFNQDERCDIKKVYNDEQT